VRITVGTDEQTDILISALRHVVGGIREFAEVSA
jgi:histidinol-phosphate/aromatic aminotransferase/cobyric acid decarboxylase-like protein